MQDRVLDLAYEVSRITEEKVGVIEQVMRQTGILAINARLEAARAGSAGSAFSIVAQEVGSVAQAIRNVSADLRAAIAGNVALLESAGERMRVEMRGARFTDLARNAIEIIDRNLYERSCDVRWWATDSAVVDVLAYDTPEARDFATRRLATILRSYTVYLDLWVADAAGRVVANGRPERYPHVIGSDVSGTTWFREAMRTHSGEDFHVCDIEAAAALFGAPVATYSTAVRRGGETQGERLGALGIFFDWEPQATAIVSGVRQSGEEPGACVMMLDQDMRVIAASNPERRDTRFSLRIDHPERGYYVSGDRLIAYALTPGYETYRGLGWYGCIDAPLAPSN
ncbi:hypothetical protein FHS31_000241 [Sphingomonas vulcanisoli]|uniref:Methyl-accepting transducer domain-containing protein n=1 Tax=Sphingomonas vulcanisoli TaxID=1658060 RepID=A0ABX0TPH3_9SPHN|nr:methyl-accepting chemotaxis protein [Sphingomonas vulcanisoli]NIJ06659.1 hypothetical protein [Sphingomonas vulcanisoli]